MKCVVVLLLTIPSIIIIPIQPGSLYLKPQMPALSKVLKPCQGFGLQKACPPPNSATACRLQFFLFL